MKLSYEPPADLLRRRVKDAASTLRSFLGSLPVTIRPQQYASFRIGFGNKPSLLAGWSYDWSNTGSNPPPWSDWSDVTKR